MSKEKKEEVIVMTYNDNPKMSSGCAQIWDNLLPRFVKLRPNWRFYCVGWQNHNRPHETKEGYVMLPCDPKTPYSFHNVLSNLLAYKPDFLITTADIGTQAGYIEPVKEAKKRGWKGKWIAYSYLDTHTWERLYWDGILAMPDINLVMVDDGEKILKEHKVPNLIQIKAGVDTKIYCPLNNREDLRKNFNLNDKFVIGFVGRNQRRKMLPALFKGFAQFSKEKNDVCLLLHTEVEGPGFDLNCLMAKYEELDPELKNKLKLTKDHFSEQIRQLIQPKSMNETYNLMDYECHAVGGEGFGLPCIESQAAGVPLIMINYSTGPELCDSGLLIPILRDKYDRLVQEVGSNGVENAIPDDKGLAKIFEEVYQDWKKGGIKLKERKESARQFSLNYDWDKLAPLWFDLFDKNLE